MYATHFGLRELPFAITPDPAYIYLSQHHREALAHLLYGTGENGGFVQLTGEVGTGKTTLIRALLEQGLDRTDIALCLNPCLTVEELLAVICDELGVAYSHEHQTLKPLLDALNAHLLRAHAAGRHTVLIVDEAQNLSREVLEQIRLLTNLETTKHKLLRIILVGQPELRELLARPDLRQLAQRITARYHLQPLTQEETSAYIDHRLRIADGHGGLFTPSARRAVHRRSGGIPRLINVICDRALLGAYSQGARRVDARMILRAAREALQGDSSRSKKRSRWHGLWLPVSSKVPRGEASPRRQSRRRWLALGIGLTGLTLVGIGLWTPRTDSDLTAAVPTPTAVSVEAGEPREDATKPKSATLLSTPAASAAPPSAPLPATKPTLAILLRKASPDDANERLLAAWGIPPLQKSRVAFCERIRTHGLRCLSGRGDWEALRRLDRPAVLRLTRPGGIPAPVLLRSLVADQATLEVAGETLTVPSAELSPLWSGQYVLLWRPQTDQPIIGPGNVGEAVRWLRRRLALAAGQPVPESLPEAFDTGLAKQLRAFQQERGLVPDGIAGGQTLVLLSNLAPIPGIPVLGPPPQGP
ncbi:MAG: AAA family ATPase [Candidatus Competibacter sp.]